MSRWFPCGMLFFFADLSEVGVKKDPLLICCFISMYCAAEVFLAVDEQVKQTISLIQTREDSVLYIRLLD